jgi:tetratricopeptide (TPR) repeat protein
MRAGLELSPPRLLHLASGGQRDGLHRHGRRARQRLRPCARETITTAREIIGIYEQLAIRSADHRRALTATPRRLVNLLLRQRNYLAAAEPLKHEIALRRQLAELGAAERALLARSLHTQGAVYFQLGELPHALAATSEAIEILASLTDDVSDQEALQADRAASMGVAVNILSGLERWNEAADMTVEVIGV